MKMLLSLVFTTLDFSHVQAFTGETVAVESSTGEAVVVESSTVETVGETVEAVGETVGETVAVESSAGETVAAESSAGETVAAESSAGETAAVESSLTIEEIVEAAVEDRKTWEALTHEEGAVAKCCYSQADAIACGDACTTDWCAQSHWHCAYCSRANAITAGDVNELAELMSCGAVEDVVLHEGSTESSEGPSVGPVVYETDLDTLIDTGGAASYKPDASEWPEGYSPQCCWGGCEGSCEHTYSWCSKDADTCHDCNSKSGGLSPEFHMCPGGADLNEIDEASIHIPDGKEFKCCWKKMAHHDTASCDNCDPGWCSDSIDQCSQCAGEPMFCDGGETIVTLAPGDAIPTGDAVPEGQQWQCCWEATCGGSTCNAPDSWCSENTGQCSDCAGTMTLCDIPPPPTLAPGAYTEEELAALLPADSEWTCCPDDPCDSNCYSELNWCGVSNTNCRQCNAVMHACPLDRRLVHESGLSMAFSTSSALPLLLLMALRI